MNDKYGITEWIIHTVDMKFLPTIGNKMTISNNIMRVPYSIKVVENIQDSHQIKITYSKCIFETEETTESKNEYRYNVKYEDCMFGVK